MPIEAPSLFTGSRGYYSSSPSTLPIFRLMRFTRVQAIHSTI